MHSSNAKNSQHSARATRANSNGISKHCASNGTTTDDVAAGASQLEAENGTPLSKTATLLEELRAARRQLRSQTIELERQHGALETISTNIADYDRRRRLRFSKSAPPAIFRRRFSTGSSP